MFFWVGKILRRIGRTARRTEQLPTDEQIYDELEEIIPNIKHAVETWGKVGAMQTVMTSQRELKGTFADYFPRGALPSEPTIKTVEEYLNATNLVSPMDDYTMTAHLRRINGNLKETARNYIKDTLAKAELQRWAQGQTIQELQKKFHELKALDMSAVIPNAETVVRTESMKILASSRVKSSAELESYGMQLWGWRYHAIADSRARETHKAQDGVTAPVEDPFWKIWIPPNGYNCRCDFDELWDEPMDKKSPRRDLRPDKGFETDHGVLAPILQQRGTGIDISDTLAQMQKTLTEAIITDTPNQKGVETHLRNQIASNPSSVPLPAIEYEPIRPIQPERKPVFENKKESKPGIEKEILEKFQENQQEAATISEIESIIEKEKRIKESDNLKHKDKSEKSAIEKHINIPLSEVQSSVNRIHEESVNNPKKTLIVSVDSNGRCVIRDSLRIVATIECVETIDGLQFSLMGSRDRKFHVELNNEITIFEDFYEALLYVKKEYGLNAVDVMTVDGKKLLYEDIIKICGNKGWRTYDEKSNKKGNLQESEGIVKEEEKRSYKFLMEVLGIDAFPIKESKDRGIKTPDTFAEDKMFIEIKEINTENVRKSIQGLHDSYHQNAHATIIDCTKVNFGREKAQEIVDRYRGSPNVGKTKLIIIVLTKTGFLIDY